MIASAVLRAKKANVREDVLEYRGVKLQNLPMRSRFTVAQIRKAVEHAVAKNARALAKKP